ncbi:hypothetical protein F3I16_04065 [Pseudomonas sp. L-22-4S-12]|uniref:hypothetical protein n=1 Tax=Pseudomonas sp. L-22-4S-12 TaxID=2610893 RepID=UPI00132BF567|nr:hypothetical protein [Pseudomonas sp. L-22-4S-12]MWV15215.1 hypothetical protein [Pseudomonas sp. L-22-4S-12]
MKWYQKASVQTALVTGLCAIIISMGGWTFSLYQENKKLSREVSEKINDAIVKFSEDVGDALRKSASLDLSPHFDTYEGAMGTMRALNQEANIYDSTVNLVEIHRYLRMYGDEGSRARLGVLMNSYADSHQAANNYLLSLLESSPGAEAASEYAALLNDRSKARAALQAFIINLGSNDFNI